MCSRLASISILFVGSDPIDRKHIKGVRGSLSDHVSCKFNITPSEYFSPKQSSMYFLACDKVRSGVHALKRKTILDFVCFNVFLLIFFLQKWFLETTKVILMSGKTNCKINSISHQIKLKVRFFENFRCLIRRCFFQFQFVFFVAACYLSFIEFSGK